MHLLIYTYVYVWPSWQVDCAAPENAALAQRLEDGEFIGVRRVPLRSMLDEIRRKHQTPMSR